MRRRSTCRSANAAELTCCLSCSGRQTGVAVPLTMISIDFSEKSSTASLLSELKEQRVAIVTGS